MKASVVDLRYWMKEILNAIDRHEEVTILYHGKVKGGIKPRVSGRCKRISEHPFFNMSQSKKAVNDVSADLRGDRYRAL
jgi:hypothetical protein